MVANDMTKYTDADTQWKMAEPPPAPAPTRRSSDGVEWNTYPSSNGDPANQQVCINSSLLYVHTWDPDEVPALVEAAKQIRDFARATFAKARAAHTAAKMVA